ncbi:MAG: zinc ribbon domain-containing protein [Planctomycetes bacterium]|nr:zinc ribbon domain-containing protein [Planctomycetota bacterium]
MPTYEYECTRCGAVTEVFQSITEPTRRRLKADDRPACNCGVAVTRRVGTGAGIIFKGSGFYQTDYRSESYKQAAKAEKEAIEGKPAKGADEKAAGSATDNGKAAKPPKPKAKKPQP